jgi:hypothetical protein
VWTWFLSVTLGCFVTAETIALVTVGSPATLSAYLRTVAGSDPRCQHVHAGRLTLLIMCGWVMAHLGWGLFGFDPHAHRRKV